MSRNELNVDSVLAIIDRILDRQAVVERRKAETQLAFTRELAKILKGDKRKTGAKRKVKPGTRSRPKNGKKRTKRRATKRRTGS